MAVYPEIYTLVRFYRGVDRAAVSRSTVRYTRPICDMPQSRQSAESTSPRQLEHT